MAAEPIQDLVRESLLATAGDISRQRALGVGSFKEKNLQAVFVAAYGSLGARRRCCEGEVFGHVRGVAGCLVVKSRFGTLYPMSEKRSKVDRGGGIHITRRSDFRLRDIRLSFDATTGDLADSSMTPELRTDIFDDWLRIAERASDDSVAARREGLKAPLDDNEGFASAVQREFEAALIAVSASAFALDAFFASVIEHAPEARVSAGSRHATIYETFKRAFALSHAQVTSARKPLQMIFQFRRVAVHPPATWAAPVLHETWNLGMEPRFVMFRAENAINAQFFARKLIAECVRKPKKTYAKLVEWCEPLKDVVPEPPGRPEWDDTNDQTVVT